MRNITHKIVGLGSSVNDEQQVEYIVRVPRILSTNSDDALNLSLKHLSVVNPSQVIHSVIGKPTNTCFNIYIQVKD